MRAAAPLLAPRADDRQRHQGARGRHAAADVGSHRAGARARSVRSSCCRVRASRSRSRSSCRPRCSRRRSTPRATELVQAEFRGPSFRLYGIADVVGVEIGGALKNVIAIAAGVVEGLGLGHNALAALITRGLAEITRLACAAGGQPGDARRAERPRRSRADLHRHAQPQPPRRHRARARPAAARHPGRHEDGRRRRATPPAPRSRSARRYGVELPIATQMAEVLDGPHATSAYGASRR